MHKKGTLVGRPVRKWAYGRQRKLCEENMGIEGTKSWRWEVGGMVPDKNLAMREKSCDIRK